MVNIKINELVGVLARRRVFECCDGEEDGFGGGEI